MTPLALLAYCTIAAALGGLAIVLFMNAEIKRLERQLSAERRARWDTEDALQRVLMVKTIREAAAQTAREYNTTT